MAEPLLKRTLSRFKTRTRDVQSAAPPSSPPQTHLTVARKQQWTNQTAALPGSSQNALGHSCQWEEPQKKTLPGSGLSRVPDSSPELVWAGSGPASVWVPRSPGQRSYLQSLDSSSRAWVLSSGKSPVPQKTWIQTAQSEDQIWYNPIPEEEEPQSRGQSLGPGLNQQETTMKEDKTEPKSSIETKDPTPEVTGGVSEKMIDKLKSPATKLRRKLSLKSRRERHSNLDTHPVNQESSSPSRKRPIRRQESSRRGYHSDGDSPELLPRQQVMSQKEEESCANANSLTGVLTIHLQGLDDMTHRWGVSRCVSMMIQVDDVTRARTATMAMTGPTLSLNHSFNIQLEQSHFLRVIILTATVSRSSEESSSRTRVCAAGGLSLPSLFKGSRSQELSLSLEPRGTLQLKLSLQGEDSIDRSEVFGVDLKILVQRESSEKPVPLIIQKSVSEINQRGLKVEGLYRLCGSASVKKQLRDWFETSSSSVDLKDFPDLHAITGVLKDYLRALPSPLITSSLYEAVKDAMTLRPLTSDPSCMTSDPELSQRTVQLLHCLPAAERATLSVLMDHLSLVADHSSLNKMTAQNLAVCFGPVLFTAVQTDQWEHSAAVRGGAKGGGFRGKGGDKGSCHGDDSGSAVDFKQHIEALHYLLQNWPVPHHVTEEEGGGARESSPEQNRYRLRQRHRRAGDWSQQYQNHDQGQSPEPEKESILVKDDFEAPFNCRLSLKDFDVLIQDFHRELSKSICL